MPVIKFDVSDVDPAAASAGGGSPAPEGFYDAKIAQIDDESPNGKNRRLHVQYEIINTEDRYARIHEYIVLVDTAKWKLDQFLQATGVSTAQKRTGQFDPAKLVGKNVRLRVVNETYTPPDGESRITAKPGGVWAPGKAQAAQKTTSNGETSDIARFLAMDEDELANAEDEIRALAEPMGIDPDSIDTWTEVVQLIANGGGGGEAEPSQDEQPRLQDSDRWREILSMDEDGIAEIAAELEQYNLTGLSEGDYESWEAYREAINDALNEGGGEAAPAETYETWTVEEMRGELKARSLNTKGGEATLRQRLLEADGQTGPFG